MMSGNRASTGAIAGAGIASIYTAHVLVLYAIRGAVPFESSGTTLSAVILAYYAGFVTGGAVVGVLVPLVKNRVGAVVVGTIGAFFVMFAIVSILEGPVITWGRREWLGAFIGSVLLGMPIALIWWKPADLP